MIAVEKLLTYLILSILYAAASMATSWMITERGGDRKIWITAGPNLLLTVLLVALVFHDLLS